MVNDRTPKVLINMEMTENYEFDDKKHYPERIFLQGKCDDTVAKISKDCGWDEDFLGRISKCKSAPETEKTLKNHMTISNDELAQAMEKLTIQDKKEESKDEPKEEKESTEDK